MIQTTILQTNFGAHALQRSLTQSGIKFKTKVIGEKYLTINTLFEIICEQQKIKPIIAIQRIRTKELVYCRHLFMYFAYTKFNHSLKSIANFLNMEDHSTIIFGRDKIIDSISGPFKKTIICKNIQADINEITELIK